MVPPDLESLTQDLLPWLAVSTLQLCSLFVSRWLFWSYAYVRWSFDFEINLIGHFTGPAAPRLPFHPQVHCQRNCGHFCYRKGGALDVLIAVSVVMLWNIIWCIKRWPAHSCPLKDPLQPREIGYRWLIADYLQNSHWMFVLHLAFIRTHIQVLVPESFLEEFHAAISSLEGDISWEGDRIDK